MTISERPDEAPLRHEDEHPSSVIVDPEGDDPPGIPDPMPVELRERPNEVEECEAMEGDAPTG
jgi:hypothetical protein